METRNRKIIAFTLSIVAASFLTVSCADDFPEFAANETFLYLLSKDTGNAAGVRLTNTDDLEITEGGEPQYVYVELKTKPKNDVTLTFTSSDETEATPSPATLTFTSDTWSEGQTLSVVPVDDDSVDADQVFTITVETQSEDGSYNSLSVRDITGTVADNDSPGVNIVANNLYTNESDNVSGYYSSIYITLYTRPSANVTIPVAVLDSSEAQVIYPFTGASDVITITPDNWDQNNEIRIQGVEDLVTDGLQPYTVRIGNAGSTDPDYDGAEGGDVEGNTFDNDSPGLSITKPGDIVTYEDSVYDIMYVALNSEPTGDVTVCLGTSNLCEAYLPSTSDTSITEASPPTPAGYCETNGYTGEITFTASDWFTARKVIVIGIHDAEYTTATGSDLPAGSGLFCDVDYPSTDLTAYYEGFTVNIEAYCPTCTSVDSTAYNSTTSKNGISYDTEDYLMFVTTDSHDGDFNGDGALANYYYASSSLDGNGIDEVDNFCMQQRDLYHPTFPGEFRAVISDGTNRRACSTANCSSGVLENINWVLGESKFYLQDDELTIIGETDVGGIFTTLDDQTGMAGDEYWTGLAVDWTPSIDDCNNWADTGGTYNGAYGLGDVTTPAAIFSGSYATFVAGGKKVLCVQTVK